MITLYTFGPAFGLPDASPFVTKALMLLKLAGLGFRADNGGLRKAPKGKLPFIDDDGTIIADSTFIRTHIETKYGFDFDAALSPEQKAIAWAVEKMCEDHLCWSLVEARWCNDANFAAGPANFFKAVPAPIRGVVSTMVRRKIRKGLYAHGMGRHAPDDIATLAARDLASLATILGEKPYLMGDAPCGADATVFSFVLGALAPVFATPIRTAAESHANLVAYCGRMRAQYFPAKEAA